MIRMRGSRKMPTACRNRWTVEAETGILAKNQKERRQHLAQLEDLTSETHAREQARED